MQHPDPTTPSRPTAPEQATTSDPATRPDPPAADPVPAAEAEQAAAILARLADDPAPPPFALLRRRPGELELLLGDPGDVVDVARLADLPLPAPGQPPVLAFVPFRQVAELGFAHHDDATPLRCLRARRTLRLTADRARAVLPGDDVPLAGRRFDLDDDAYADTVKRVIEDEIGRGEGANFVIRRDLLAHQPLPPVRAALAVLGRLLDRESGATWVFAAHLPRPPAATDDAGPGRSGPDGGRVPARSGHRAEPVPGTSGPAADPVPGVGPGDLVVVGATPELHVSARGGEVLMNPISGTFRYPPGGPTRQDLLAFLRDTKEVEELFMVVDEELKMMSRLCERGGRVLGPFLAPMRHLAHTEYLLTGRSTADPRDVLRETMFAATVTGSPLENACRVIARHERTGRGYYSGTVALIGAGPDGPELEAPILIRSAYLGPDGAVRVPVGATLVRHSVPEHEVAETRAKVAGLLSAFPSSAEPVAQADGHREADGYQASGGHREVDRYRGADGCGEAAGPGEAGGHREADGYREAPAAVVRRAAEDAEVAAALAARNARLAPFWLQEQTDLADPALVGRTALVVDAEDAWTAMLAHVLRRLGMTARVVGWSAVTAADADAADLLVAGPGPGDPRDLGDPRMAALHHLVRDRRATGRPLLAVCLSHQVLAGLLGLPVGPLPAPHQGTQRRVRAFGRDVRVGFYNTFTARVPATGPFPVPGVTASTAGPDGEVVALRGPGFASVQFHLESVLSPDGVDLLRDLAADLLAAG